MPFAIIAGTGIYDIPGITTERQVIETAYGDAVVYVGQGENSDVIFLTRHGADHSVPPHLVNYRANIKALEQLGVKRIFANYAVGSINPEFTPQGVAPLYDALDFTNAREHTFFDGGENGVAHVEMSEPYCKVLTGKFRELASDFDLALLADAVYATHSGPRFETPAEIKMYGMLGADVVGMTGMPEVNLARELGMSFAGITLSINWAAGVLPKITIVRDGLDEIRAKILQTCIAAGRATSDEDCTPAVLI